MPRATSSVASHKRKKKILKMAKGFRGGRSKLFRTATEAVDRSLAYAYKGRKQRKRELRRLWISRINAAARQHGTRYSVLMNGLSKSDIRINRKILADLAVRDSAAFKAIHDEAMAALK